MVMIIDHSLGFAQSTELVEPWMHVVRLSFPRLALPAFMVCSGMLLAGRSMTIRRWTEVLIAALIVNAGALLAGMTDFVPDILVLWCLVMVFGAPIRRYPATAVVLGLLQSMYWRVPIGGYQPGLVLAFVALGMLIARSGDRELLEPLGSRLPDWVASIGRRPLSWYVGHLSLLGGLTVCGSYAGWW